MNESYLVQFRITKGKLLNLPKGKQFDFSETLIFGRFDLFCRRVVKLIDMVSTIYQFQSLSQHRFDGMEVLVESFRTIMEEFRNKRHDLLDFHCQLRSLRPGMVTLTWTSMNIDGHIESAWRDGVPEGESADDEQGPKLSVRAAPLRYGAHRDLVSPECVGGGGQEAGAPAFHFSMQSFGWLETPQLLRLWELVNHNIWTRMPIV